MPDNDERDPLDRWLHQQVRPLPPPPGTFELITRRARHRKVRKLAITIASAAAVAAAIGVAVPNLAILRVVQPSTSASGVAAGRSLLPSGTGTQQPTGSGSRDTSPSASSSAGGLTEPSGPVPANFEPSSVTFVDPEHGWVIGQAGTPGKCADVNPDFCTSIVRTDNAGQSWHGGPAPETGAAAGATGVSGIRFLDGVNGWAFGPELWATHNEGNSWHQIATGGQRVTDLETAGNRAFALFATCSGSATTGFAADCTSYTLMTTTADSDDWTPVGGLTSGLTDGGAATSAMIALTATTGYLLAPDGTLYSGPLDGAWQKVGTAQCQPGTALANGLPSRGMLALIDATHPVVACASQSGTQVWTSSDGGALWTAGPALPLLGTAMSLAAAPDGTLVLATTTSTEFLAPGAALWKLAKGTPQGGFSYVGMTTDSQGVAIAASAADQHEIWMTFDSGQTWTPATSITPGN